MTDALEMAARGANKYKELVSPYIPTNKDGTVFYTGAYRNVHCNLCSSANGVHITCESCGFHGDFDEPGDCYVCPECGWGAST